jgi:hypothetical protein
MFQRAITLAKKKVATSLLITLGTISFVHWTISTLTAHDKNETDEKVGDTAR